MRTIKHPLYGTLIRLEDLKAGDVILVRRRINSKSQPFWPYKLTRSMPEHNAHGFACMPGHFLMPEGDLYPGEYSATARAIMFEDEMYVVGKPMQKNWVKNEMKKAVAERDSLQQKIDWLETLEKQK